MALLMVSAIDFAAKWCTLFRSVTTPRIGPAPGPWQVRHAVSSVLTPPGCCFQIADGGSVGGVAVKYVRSWQVVHAALVGVCEMTMSFAPPWHLLQLPRS